MKSPSAPKSSRPTAMVSRMPVSSITASTTHPDDYDARANLMWCGTLAHNGLCGTGVEEDWASHAIEHELSAMYGVAHGAGLAVIFPAWLTWMLSHNDSKLKQWAKNVWNVDTPEEGIKRYKEFLHSIGPS